LQQLKKRKHLSKTSSHSDYTEQIASPPLSFSLVVREMWDAADLTLKPNAD
jgi:hypothetical protein